MHIERGILRGHSTIIMRKNTLPDLLDADEENGDYDQEIYNSLQPAAFYHNNNADVVV